MKTLLICGATGFIGRNLLDYYYKKGTYKIVATYQDRFHHPAKPFIENYKNVEWISYCDFRNPEDVADAIKGTDIVLQFAATTSGVNDIINRPYIHVTDNAVMNSYILRECYEQDVKHFIFPSCTVMYQPSDNALKETDFNGND